MKTRRGLSALKRTRGIKLVEINHDNCVNSSVEYVNSIM